MDVRRNMTNEQLTKTLTDYTNTDYTNGDVWFQQTFKAGRDDISATDIQKNAIACAASHDFFPPPLPSYGQVRECGYVAGTRIPVRWVKVWDFIHDEVLVRFDVMGTRKIGAFFAQWQPEKGVKIWFSGGNVAEVPLKDWLEGDYNFDTI